MAANLAALPPSRVDHSTKIDVGSNAAALSWVLGNGYKQTSLFFQEAQSLMATVRKEWTSIQITDYRRHNKWHRWEHSGPLDGVFGAWEGFLEGLWAETSDGLLKGTG